MRGVLISYVDALMMVGMDSRWKKTVAGEKGEMINFFRLALYPCFKIWSDGFFLFFFFFFETYNPTLLNLLVNPLSSSFFVFSFSRLLISIYSILPTLLADTKMRDHKSCVLFPLHSTPLPHPMGFNG